VAGRVTGRPIGGAEDVTIVDLSTGGFLLETSQPFPVDSVHQFRVALPDGRWSTELTAVAVHAKERPINDSVRYLTGFAFLDPQGEEAQRRLEKLVNHVTSVVSYF
jgi:hypothetical protein